MKPGLWMVIVVVSVWIGFLLGYSVASHTARQSVTAAAAAAEAPAGAGGYGR